MRRGFGDDGEGHDGRCVVVDGLSLIPTLKMWFSSSAPTHISNLMNHIPLCLRRVEAREVIFFPDEGWHQEAFLDVDWPGVLVTMD
jgi:hypothetical protein